MISNNMENFSKTELENEKWKDIDGYDGMYQVSDLGRVRSKHSGEWKILKCGKNNNGYLLVWLYKDRNRTRITVHRLVANACIPNSDESKTTINHNNEIKTENTVTNLEWGTAQYNMNYNDIHHKRNTKRRKLAKLYRPDLTYQQNIDLFKGQGINCSWLTICNLRKDLGLTKHYRPRKKTTKTRTHLSLKNTF